MQQYLAIVDLSGGTAGGTGSVGGGSWSSTPSLFNPNPGKDEDPDSQYNNPYTLPIIGIVHPLYTNLERYTNTLSDANKEFWNKSQSSKIVKSIQEYLKTHPLSNSLKQILDQLLDEARLNGAIYDIEKSVASPANIDFSAVAGNSANEQRFNAIYNTVASSPLFKKMITNMFGTSERYNVKFKIGPTVNANGTTIPASSNSTVTNTVTLSPDFLTQGSTVSIATTIIHEMIHAYLNVLRLRGGVDPSIIASDDLAACIHNYYKNDLANEAGQHNFMAQNFGPVITQMLLEIKNSLFTAAEIHKVEHPEVYESFYLYAPLNISPANPLTQSQQILLWNWSNFFQWQSYDGLVDHPEFINIFPRGSNDYYFCKKYIGIGNSAFKHE
ncbi:SprT-like domain-containing protein [Flavobacterium psychrotrophum]|uniref:SprT-like domain-containing protein n=1 Tax=Flavobacterium psychrotrophum TaxID=2294119 RepID=UPI0013C43A26|nr:SprT-like domain-containing protein [Flavobacterium psychrotrophum]